MAKISYNKTERKNKTGFKGVVEIRKDLFQGHITLRIAGKQYTKTTGSFPTAAEAYQERVKFIKKLL